MSQLVLLWSHIPSIPSQSFCESKYQNGVIILSLLFYIFLEAKVSFLVLHFLLMVEVDSLVAYRRSFLFLLRDYYRHLLYNNIPGN